MKPERQTEHLIDALAFAFVSVAVNELGVRPSMAAIDTFRRAAQAAVARATEAPFGDDEPTEPRSAAYPKPRH